MTKSEAQADGEWQAELDAARMALAQGVLRDTPPSGKGVKPADATCRGCGQALSEALIDAGDNTGLHANCEDAPEPPSTVGEMEGALYRLDANRDRSQQKRLGPSELGTPCERQIAMKLAGVPQKDRGLAWAPLCGTAVHAMMEDTLRQENEILGRERYLIETPLDIEPPQEDGSHIHGHGDAFDIDNSMVIDWKYTGTTARRKAKRIRCLNSERVSQEYRVQTHLYGLGHANAGRDVKWVRVVMLARSHDYSESVEWTERYRSDIAQWALRRYHRIKERVPNDGYDSVPAKPSESTCKWCPFWQPDMPAGTVNDGGCAGYQEEFFK